MIGVLTVNDIKKILNSSNISDYPVIINDFSKDYRSGVKKLLEAYAKKYEAYMKELGRLETLMMYERQLYEEGVEIISGIDEVGRGPLAGPVVACAVIIKHGCSIEGVDDSKKLSEKKREDLYDKILDKAVDFSIGCVPPSEIDNINILQATYKAMRLAVNSLKVKPEFILVDAVTIPDIAIRQRGIIKGDSKSLSIAAASIIAKVTRDRMMKEFNEIFPEYGFARNKGYGSKDHIDAIKKYGICPIHRRSFVHSFI